MKNEHGQQNVCRVSLECSAFQLQLIAQFIFQKVRNQTGILETKDYSFTLKNRVNGRQLGREKKVTSNCFYPSVPFCTFVRAEWYSSVLYDWWRCSQWLHSEDGAISATPYWICTEQAPSTTRYNLWQHVESNSGSTDWLNLYILSWSCICAK